MAEAYSGKKSLMAPGLMGQSITAGKAGWRVPEAAGHIESAVRKQKEVSAGAQIPFSFLFRLGSGKGAALRQCGVSLSDVCGNALTDTQSCVS